MNAYRREYHQRKPHKNSQYRKKYSNEHKDQIREYNKEYAKKKQNSPERLAEKAARKAEREARKAWKLANPRPEDIEKRKEYSRAYRAANKERIKKNASEYGKKNRAAISKQQRAAERANPEKYKARRRAYYEKNKEHLAAYKKEFYQKFPEKRRAVERRRRARIRNAGWEKYTEQQVIELYGLICYICEEEIENRTCLIGSPGWERTLHMDHVFPIAKGGSDTLYNVRPTHAQCNLRKHVDLVK
jgi:5-methylcytosine-specific restriction endonuclease McrA